MDAIRPSSISANQKQELVIRIQMFDISEQGGAGRSRAEQGGAGRSRAEQGGAGRSRGTEQSRHPVVGTDHTCNHMHMLP